MRKLDESISMPYAIGDFVVRVSASIGLAGYPESGSSVEALLQIADEAMYAAKTDRNGALRRARAARWRPEPGEFTKASAGIGKLGQMNQAYVHGYDLKESLRLQDQASSLVELLHSDTSYPEGQTVLEAGCGIGSQTVTLARNSPGARITSIDISQTQLAQARRAIDAAGARNVTLQQADIFDLPFGPRSFDHVFVCFVLEHLSRPADALQVLKRMLKPGGTLTVIEGDHESAYFHPESDFARAAIQCLVDLQATAGGNSLIGRQLFPLVSAAGYRNVQVSPRMVYVDSRKPRLVDGFTRKTFTAMVEGVRKPAIEGGLMSASDFDRGVADLYRTAEDDGVFCYTFFKATAFAP